MFGDFVKNDSDSSPESFIVVRVVQYGLESSDHNILS